MREWISEDKLQAKLREMGIDDISRTTIRQCSMIGSALEAESGEAFSHLEFGVPGIPACPIGIEAQKKALERRMEGLYAEDAGKEVRLSHENKDIQKLYKEFLGTPGSEKSHHLLHTVYHQK